MDAKFLIRSQMHQLGLSVKDLQQRLLKQGVIIKESSLANKIYRGKFSADFFIKLLYVMGIEFVLQNSDQGFYVSTERKKL